MRQKVLIYIACVAIFLGLVPVIFYWSSGAVPYWLMVPLNLMAWIGVAVSLLTERGMLKAVDLTAEEMSLPLSPGSLQVKLQSFINEARRYHRAAYAFRIETSVKGTELAPNLQRISNLAYQELRAHAVELSLFDEESGQWSQALVIGAPRTVQSQSLLEEATNGGRQTDFKTLRRDGDVLVQPVMFAGSLFGALRVELERGVEPTTADLQVLHLLATQGALMLVDARFTNELIRMRRTSEESIRAKTGFLAQLSHEIRGPLGIILNGVELMMDGLCGAVSEMQKDTLGMIRDSGEHLLDLVNDVLDYAKVEAGKVTPKTQEISVKHLLEDLVSVVRSQAQQKNHKLVLEPVDKALGVLCDKRHARQMMINFLTNAVKYTPDGGQITVRTERVSGNRIKISVQDSGIGIPEDQRSKVFGAFERVDNKYSMNQVGTGLGMPLTRKLAEVNGGAVDFDSHEGQGSTFWLVLPAAAIAIEQPGQTDAGVARVKVPKGRPGETILLVDNDLEARHMLEQYLRHEGFSMVLAQNGSEVLKLLREQRIDLAVLENDLPDLSGEEMISVLRSNPRSCAVPIILLSAKAFVFDIERFLKLGVDRCLSKPVELSEVAETARRLIDETKAESALNARAAVVTAEA